MSAPNSHSNEELVRQLRALAILNAGYSPIFRTLTESADVLSKHPSHTRPTDPSGGDHVYPWQSSATLPPNLLYKAKDTLESQHEKRLTLTVDFWRARAVYLAEEILRRADESGVE